ncbi:MAG: hypothetical protein K0U41_06670 [Gammaproteobacteria bacterium]|nr:hypothetical protein [Gammaproteobacteria bacterium]
MPFNLRPIAPPDLDSVSRILERGNASVSRGVQGAADIAEELRVRRADRASKNAISRLSRARTEGDLNAIRDNLYLPAHLQTDAFNEADLGSIERVLGYSKTDADINQAKSATNYNNNLATSVNRATERADFTFNEGIADKRAFNQTSDLQNLLPNDPNDIQPNLYNVEKNNLDLDATAASNYAAILNANTNAANANRNKNILSETDRQKEVDQANNTAFNALSTLDLPLGLGAQEFAQRLQDNGILNENVSVDALYSRYNANTAASAEAIAAADAADAATVNQYAKDYAREEIQKAFSGQSDFVKVGADGRHTFDAIGFREVAGTDGLENADALASALQANVNRTNELIDAKDAGAVAKIFKKEDTLDNYEIVDERTLRQAITANAPNLGPSGVDAAVSAVTSGNAWDRRLRNAGVSTAEEALIVQNVYKNNTDLAQAIGGDVGTRNIIEGIKNQAASSGEPLTRAKALEIILSDTGRSTEKWNTPRKINAQLDAYEARAREQGITDPQLIYGSLIYNNVGGVDKRSSFLRQFFSWDGTDGDGELGYQQERFFDETIAKLGDPSSLKAANFALGRIQQDTDNAIAQNRRDKLILTGNERLDRVRRASGNPNEINNRRTPVNPLEAALSGVQAPTETVSTPVETVSEPAPIQPDSGINADIIQNALSSGTTKVGLRGLVGSFGLSNTADELSNLPELTDGNPDNDIDAVLTGLSAIAERDGYSQAETKSLLKAMENVLRGR